MKRANLAPVGMRRWLMPIVACWAAMGARAGDAGDPRFALWTEPAKIVHSAGQTEVRVYLSSTEDRVQGWSFGLRATDSADGAVTLRVVAAETGEDLKVAGPDGEGPAFESRLLEPAGTPSVQRCDACIGVTQGVILDMQQQVTLDATARFETLRATVTLAGVESLVPARLSFVNDLGSPRINTVVVLGSESLAPATLRGSEVYLGSCEPNFSPRVGSVAGAAGLLKDVPVFLDFNREGTGSQAIQAWSLGIRHDGSVLELVDVTTDGTDVLALKDGGPPDFSEFKYVPGPPPNAAEGFTHGVVIDYGAVITLAAVNDFLDCIATYRLTGQPSCPQRLETQVVPAGDLSDPVVRMVVVLNGDSWVPCEARAGTVSILCAVPFVRGDSNGDGRVDMADGIFTLQYVFQHGGAPWCGDAADANDDGLVDGSDGVYTLRWQFLHGQAPPEPFPAVGLDPTGDTLVDC